MLCRLGGQKVYDVTSYLEEHPGGPEIIMEFAGKEADDMFEDIGHSKEARQAQSKLLIGTVKVWSVFCYLPFYLNVCFLSNLRTMGKKPNLFLNHKVAAKRKGG